MQKVRALTCMYVYDWIFDIDGDLQNKELKKDVEFRQTWRHPNQE